MHIQDAIPGQEYTIQMALKPTLYGFGKVHNVK